MVVQSNGKFLFGSSLANGDRGVGAVQWEVADNDAPLITAHGTLKLDPRDASSSFFVGQEIYQAGITAGNGIALQIGQGNTIKNTGKLRFVYAGNSSDNNRLTLGFHTNDDILNVMAGGNVGIGTVSPGSKLEVLSGANYPSSGARFAGNANDFNISVANTGTGGQDYRLVSTSSASDAPSSFQIVNRSNSNISAFTIAASGNVGLGVNVPTQALDILGGSALIRNGNSSSSYAKSQIMFGWNNTNTYRHAIKTRHEAGYTTGNSIDFYLWKQGVDAPTAEPSLNVMSLLGNGNVGIGTNSPSYKLEVVQTGTRTAAGNPITFDGQQSWLASSLRVTNSGSNTSSVYTGRMGIQTWGPDANNQKYPFLNIETLQPNMPIIMEVNEKATMQVFQNQVLIGSDLPFPSSDAVIPYSGLNYTLGVRGRIVSSGITCKDLSQWSDFVFNEDYTLKSLDEVADYVAANKHLPDVPSAKDVVENGIDVSEMLKIQMQKIEELTLYSIQQQKQLAVQQEQISKLQHQLTGKK
ncbi:hypothetical protein DN068_19540 [Taibaiella soli]|uniref:Peptidase S74 domain-containing protein n=2 Tax=Taibaiella soli TaxID=1649169 RepID=A0A2W2A7F4_9BACT|nr:hypothetical protein DN068_19540 [Taibaiella soli]